MSYHKASEVHRGPGAVAAVDAVSPLRRRARQAKARVSAARDKRLAQIVSSHAAFGAISRGTNLTSRPAAPAPTNQPYAPPSTVPTLVTNAGAMVGFLGGRQVTSTGTQGTRQPGNINPITTPVVGGSPSGGLLGGGGRLPPPRPRFPGSSGPVPTTTTTTTGTTTSGGGTVDTSGGGTPYDPTAGGGGAIEQPITALPDTSTLTTPDLLPDVDLPVVGTVSAGWLLAGGALAAFLIWGRK